MDAVKIKLSEIADLKGGLSTGNYGHRVNLSEKAPTEDDINYYLGTIWIENKENVWVLVKIDNAKAVWYKIVTPEFTEVSEVVANIESTFSETKEKAETAETTANSVKSDADAGKFNGFDPIVQLENTTDGVKLTITDADGEKSSVIPKGDKGDAGTIAVGTVSTGAVGSDVKIENVGTSSSAILNFTIPRGEQGFGLTIKGKYDTYSTFIAAHATGSEGENWEVGTDIYTWNATTKAWQNLGELKGADGAYFTPVVTDGVLSWSNNGGLSNPASYDLLGATKTYIIEQGYADSDEIQTLINNTLYQSINGVY